MPVQGKHVAPKSSKEFFLKKRLKNHFLKLFVTSVFGKLAFAESSSEESSWKIFKEDLTKKILDFFFLLLRIFSKNIIKKIF
jgi:hypothetical protein